MGVRDWSKDADLNVIVDGVNIAEECDMANLNNGIRGVMGETKAWYDLANPIYTATGTANAIVLTPLPSFEAYTAREKIMFMSAATNTGAVTLNISGRGSKAVVLNGGTALIGGEIVENSVVSVVYDGTKFLLLNPANVIRTNGAQTLSGKTLNSPTLDTATLTSPAITSPTINGGTIADGTLAGTTTLDADHVFSGEANYATGIKTPYLHITAENAIKRDVSNSYLNLAGGNTGSDGASVIVYGSTHASDANKGKLCVGGINTLIWDSSSVTVAGSLSSSNAIDAPILKLTSSSGVMRNADTSYLYLSGGAAAASGGCILLYGPSHASQPSSGRLRSGTDDALVWNGSSVTIQQPTTVNSNLSITNGGTVYNYTQADGSTYLYNGYYSSTHRGCAILSYGPTHATNPGRTLIYGNWYSGSSTAAGYIDFRADSSLNIVGPSGDRTAVEVNGSRILTTADGKGWAGVSTATNANTTSFPIGTNIIAVSPYTNSPRCVSATLYLMNTNDYAYVTNLNGANMGTALAGSWRQRGYVGSSNVGTMFQRVA